MITRTDLSESGLRLAIIKAQGRAKPPTCRVHFGSSGDETSQSRRRLADDLDRLCCAETEGKFFDCVTDSIQEIIAALRDGSKSEWSDIATRPECNDLMWFCRGDTFEGPREPSYDDADYWDWWCYARPPELPASLTAGDAA